MNINDLNPGKIAEVESNNKLVAKIENDLRQLQAEGWAIDYQFISLPAAKRHRWKHVKMLVGECQVCVKCGIEKYKMRFGWEYRFTKDGLTKESYIAPPCNDF